jgi:anti-anti-sigma factor
MGDGLALRRAAEQALAEGASTLRLDLRRCTYMDSTFLGTLHVLLRAFDPQGRGHFALVSPSPQCDRLLLQMGLADFFPVVAAEEPDVSAWAVLPCAWTDAGAFQDQVVEAHRELASLEGPAGEPFRAVVRCLEQDLQAKKGR